MSIRNWTHAKDLLLSTFQGFQVERKTTRDLMTCIQEEGGSLSSYLDKLTLLRAQVPNESDDVVIEAAIQGLQMGQCTAYLTRETPETVVDLFREIRKFPRAEEDLRRRKAARNSFKQNTPRQNQATNQRNNQNFRPVNNLQDRKPHQEDTFAPVPETPPRQSRDNGHASRGGRPPRGRGRGRGRGGAPENHTASSVATTKGTSREIANTPN